MTEVDIDVVTIRRTKATLGNFCGHCGADLREGSAMEELWLEYTTEECRLDCRGIPGFYGGGEVTRGQNAEDDFILGYRCSECNEMLAGSEFPERPTWVRKDLPMWYREEA